MTISEAIKRLVEGENLSADQAQSVLEDIMSGHSTDSQIGSLLTALRMKGETADEITGFARAMRARVSAVRPDCVVSATISGTERDALIDTCGTGGDASGTFNISTATAFVVAGCGVRVAKHGNRSVSSHCGSADVIEALGVRIEIPPDRIARCIDQVGIGFLHAPLLHTAMKHVAPARRQLGIRTIFNLLGPLTNPAGADTQVIGVYSAHLTELLAQSLGRLGSRRAMVVHGSDGLDEVTITGESKITELRRGEMRTFTITPEEFGISRATLRDIQGGDAKENAQIILDILSNKSGPRRDIVLMNAAAALVASERAADFREGVGMATDSIARGRAKAKLDQLIEMTSMVE